MKHNKLYILVAVLVLFSMILAACAKQETPAAVVTEAPEVPTEVHRPRSRFIAYRLFYGVWKCVISGKGYVNKYGNKTILNNWITVVGKPAATVITSSPFLSALEPSFFDIKDEIAKRLADEPELQAIA